MHTEPLQSPRQRLRCADGGRTPPLGRQVFELSAIALSSRGAPVPVALQVVPSLDALRIEVPGDVRHFSLGEVEVLATGEEAREMLVGRLPYDSPPDVCALALRDGTCLALQVSAPQDLNMLADLLDGSVHGP